MPSITVHTRAANSDASTSTNANPLPNLLRTPLGLAIIEIQGSLNISDALPSSDEEIFFSERHVSIGRLVFPLLNNDSIDTAPDATMEGPWMKKVYLYVGDNQRLLGEVRKLPKVFAVLRKRVAQSKTGRTGANVTAFDSEDEAEHDTMVPAEEELEIADLIRYKIVFGTRPEFV